MSGVDNQNLRAIERAQHIEQSLIDLLTTFRGERTSARQQYGLDLLKYIGQPYTEELERDIIADIYTSINDWEPRILIASCVVKPTSEPGATFKLLLTYIDVEDITRQVNSLETTL